MLPNLFRWTLGFLLLGASVAEAQKKETPPAKVVIPQVDRTQLPVGKVQIDLCEEGLPTKNQWPEESLKVTETYTEDLFGFFDVPQKYIDTGVRADRGHPYLLRASAVVSMPAGKHRLLLRGRGATRLFIDDKLMLSTPFPPEDGSGHGTVASQKYLELGPDFRFMPPGNREKWIEFASDKQDHLVVLETIVGGFVGKSRRRPELGETVVAISWQGETTWQLLSPSRRVPYTDAGWLAYEKERMAHYEQINATNRQKLRQQQSAYWNKRREAAKQYLKQTAESPVPELPKDFPAHNPIDHFLAQTIVRVAAQKQTAVSNTVDYFKQVQPLLESKCYACHTGGNAKGKLRLDESQTAFQGGKNDGPAITPKKPEASSILSRVRSKEDDEVMPPKGERLTEEEIRLLETWIQEGASWPELNAERTTLTSLTDDRTFLRRVTLDTVGVVPTLEEIETFDKDTSKDKRAKVIDRLLNDPRWADHWMGYWQDVLAENPNILNPTLNNTGPFRWWLYESLLDNKPMDLFVTELIRMKGSERFGGPAGFGIASQNDVPMAAKGTIIASAFLGVEMKCARCHDAPAHQSKQHDLFQLAAMLGTKPLNVPATSSVPLDKIHQGGRKPLIAVTLKPGSKVEPAWPFPEFCPPEIADQLAQYPQESRDRLATLLTAPQNERLAQVLANRIWKQFMGQGLVEPVDDWEKGKATHPELLRWLARELVRGGYDLKHLARLILNSHAYQRSVDSTLRSAGPLYAAMAPRRMSAEQIVDSLFHVTGKPFSLEEVNLDIDGRRELNNSITLGKPRRAWMLTSTSNERDRPSLSLPRIQAVTDVMQAFGWRGARQDPASIREQSPNVLQPAILAHGIMGTWLTRLSEDHGITQLVMQPQPLEPMLDALFLRILTRLPTPEERQKYSQYLQAGYETRLQAPAAKATEKRKPQAYVSWSNHLDPQATILRQQQEAAARKGDPPTDRLNPQWREKMEDVLWAILNTPEMLFLP